MILVIKRMKKRTFLNVGKMAKSIHNGVNYVWVTLVVIHTAAAATRIMLMWT